MIIGNGKVITNDVKNPYIENGAVYIKDQVIEAVGKFEDLKASYPGEDVVDVKGRLIMPGMINAHTHIYSAYARGMSVSNPTDNFLNVLENLWWRLDRNLTLEDCKWNAYTTYIESIRNGVTTTFDHHSSPNAAKDSLFTIAEVAKKLGVRTSLCYEVSDRDGQPITEQEIAENVDFIKAYNTTQDDMIKGLFGMHASFTVSNETLYKVKEEMADIDAGYHIHVAEGIEDQYDARKKYGRSVVERLFDFDLLGPKTIAVHGVHTNQRELEIIKETNTTVAHNPMSNMNNAVGCPPVVAMIKQGIRVGLGTDAYTHDMFESMKVANILQSHHLCDPTVGFMETKALQFDNNPAICNQYFNRPLGMLKEGAYADIITVDYKPYTPLNKDNYFGHLLFGVTGRMVNDTMINGKFVMKDRVILPVDEDEIMAKSAERAAKIWPNM